MKNKTIAILTLLFSSTSFAEVVTLDVLLDTGGNKSPETVIREAAGNIYNGLSAIPEVDRTQAQQQLWETLDYLINTAAIDDPNAINAVLQISPKRNGTSTIVTRKSPSTIPVKGIGKRLSALRKSTSRRFSFLDAVSSRPSGAANSYQLMPGLVKYNTDPALEEGGLLDQRLSGFITTNAIFSKQSETLNEAGFKGNTKQLTAGADYRIDNNTFAGAAYSYVNGNMDMTQGGDLDNAANTLLFYGTRSIQPNWFVDATLSLGKRNFEMQRSVTFTLNNNVNTVANSSPEGSFYGFSVSTGYDLPTKAGHSISLLASFNYTKSSIDAFKETGSSGYNLAVNKQEIVSKMIDVGIEWRQAISVDFGVLLPQVSFKWSQELQDKSDPVNAYFIADPNNTMLSFETGNKDQGFMNLQLGVTAVLPRGLAAFVQYETQQFIDDYQQSMISLGARKEF